MRPLLLFNAKRRAQLQPLPLNQMVLYWTPNLTSKQMFLSSLQD